MACRVRGVRSEYGFDLDSDSSYAYESAEDNVERNGDDDHDGTIVRGDEGTAEEQEEIGHEEVEHENLEVEVAEAHPKFTTVIILNGFRYTRARVSSRKSLFAAVFIAGLIPEERLSLTSLWYHLKFCTAYMPCFCSSCSRHSRYHESNGSRCKSAILVPDLRSCATSNWSYQLDTERFVSLASNLARKVRGCGEWHDVLRKRCLDECISQSPVRS
ncbi:unnamed protein product [Phytophthora fragariaefolia]|uniref:Unnamed protein product n=1 Tax=Phytophthora fragariaefolia TaxID=1490495 RepID=A0A9W6XRB8_9STRA|nr:unnamed protein product [Phytophthora fragariaefolia]